MTRERIFWGAAIALLGLESLVFLWLINEVLRVAEPAPVPQAPPAPTISTHVDNAHGAVCWLASSPHGVGISCLKSGPGEFGP